MKSIPAPMQATALPSKMGLRETGRAWLRVMCL